MNQFVKKIPTKTRDVERSFFLTEIIIQNLLRFEIVTQEGINDPIFIIVAFQQSDREHDQKIANDTFYRPPITSAQSIIGAEKYPYSAILIKYIEEYCSQGYGLMKEVFIVLTKDDNIEPYISYTVFK